MTTQTSTLNPGTTLEFDHSEAIGNQLFGFWLYIMSDLVLFGALFATYAVLGHNYAGGPTGKELFDLPYAFGETMLLLFSSAACGLAMLAVHHERKDRVSLWLTITFLLGLGFIGMELREFAKLIFEGHRPERSAFLSSFFTLVGTHGAHVTAGLIWIAVMMFQLRAKGLTAPVQSRLMRLSLFWHFLDIVWVAVFTVVYLMGVM
jgi:cytochrome o ubiquinol oxidase subunit 3